MAYTQHPDKLAAAFQNSQDVMCAWNGDQLIGLVRAIGDKTIILYIQDILVLQSYKRLGIGKKLIKLLLEKYHDVRQVVLLTDDTAESRGFMNRSTSNPATRANWFRL